MVLDRANLEGTGLPRWEALSASSTWGDDTPAAWGMDSYESELKAMLAGLGTGIQENQLFHQRVALLMGQTLDAARARGAPIVPLCQALGGRTQRALALHATATSSRDPHGPASARSEPAAAFRT